MDTEITVVNKALELFNAVITEPLIRVGGKKKKKKKQKKTSDDSEEEYSDEEDDFDETISAWRVLSRMSDSGGSGGSQAKGGVNALKTALKRSLDDSPSDSLKLLRVLKSAAVKSLNLSDDNKTDGKVKLFNKDIIFLREGVWCMLEALSSCSTVVSTTNRGGGGGGGTSSNTGNSTRNFDLIGAVRKSKLDGTLYRVGVSGDVATWTCLCLKKPRRVTL